MINALNNLANEISQIRALLNGYGTQFNNFVNQTRLFSRNFGLFMANTGNGRNVGGGGGGRGGGAGGGGNVAPGANPPAGNSREYLNSIRGVATMFSISMKELTGTIDPLIRRAYATNTSLGGSLSMDQLKVAASTGVSMAELSNEILALREQGIQSLDKSTIGLIARFKATDQNVKQLVNFLGENALNLRLNSAQSRAMAQNLSEFALRFGQRQDSMLALAGSLSEGFRLQAGLGAGGALTEAFAKFGATLGSRADGQVKQLAQMFSGDNLPALIALGLQDYQERIANSTGDAQVALIKEAVIQGNQRILQMTSGLGKSSADTMILKNILGIFGGENALVFQELTTALQDQKAGTDALTNAFVSTRNLMSAANNVLQVLSMAVTGLSNIPFVGTALVTAFTAYGAATITLRLSILALTTQVRLATAAQNLRNAQGAGSALGGIIGWVSRILPVVSVIAGVAGGLYSLLGDNNKETKEINRKTPDTAGTGPGGLRSSIISDLVNITNRLSSTGLNARQIELLESIAKSNSTMARESDGQSTLPSQTSRSR